MMKHFSKLGTPLRSVLKYPGCHTQILRFQSAGFHMVETQNRKNDVQPLLARAWPWRSGGFDWPGGLSSTFACLLNLLLMLLQKHAGWNKQAKDSRFENHPGLLSCYVST